MNYAEVFYIFTLSQIDGDKCVAISWIRLLSLPLYYNVNFSSSMFLGTEIRLWTTNTCEKLPKSILLILIWSSCYRGLWGHLDALCYWINAPLLFSEFLLSNSFAFFWRRQCFCKLLWAVLLIEKNCTYSDASAEGWGSRRCVFIFLSCHEWNFHVERVVVWNISAMCLIVNSAV